MLTPRKRRDQTALEESSSQPPTFFSKLRRRCFVVLIVALAVDSVLGQATPAPGPAPPSGSTPGTGGGSSTDREFKSVYSNGDLILINPIQSTSILITITVFSTALEYLFEFLSAQRNRYTRNIVFATKEECAVISASHMFLVFAAFSFPLRARWHVVLLFVALTLVFKAILFMLFCISLTWVMKIRGRGWRIFEWARMDADSHHSKDEQLFKMAKQFFISVCPFPIQLSNQAVSSDRSAMANFAQNRSLVIFSSYIAYIEMANLKHITDFTALTWVGLGLVIVLNGFRAITVATIDISGGQQGSIAQSITYVIFVGYGTFAVFLLAWFFIRRRLSNFLFKKLANGLPGSESSNANANAGGSSNKGGGAGSRSPQASGKKNKDTAEHDVDAERGEAVAQVSKQTLYFGSIQGSLQVFKIFVLIMLWYLSVLIVGLVHVSWRDMGWFALIFYVLALVPPVLTVLILPSAIHTIFMCGAIGPSFDALIVKQILEGTIDVNEAENVTAEEAEEGSNIPMPGDKKAEKGKDGSNGGGGDREHHHAQRSSPDRKKAAERDGDYIEDEWDGPAITLQDESAANKDLALMPSRLIGVAPTVNRSGLSGAKDGKKPGYVMRQSRPVFQEGINATPMRKLGSGLL